MEGFAQHHTAVGSKARFLGSHLGTDALPCLLNVNCKTLCSWSAQSSVSGTHRRILSWSVMGPWFCSFSGNLCFPSFCQQTFGELLECARHSASHWVDSIKQDKSQSKRHEKDCGKVHDSWVRCQEASALWSQKRLLWCGGVWAERKGWAWEFGVDAPLFSKLYYIHKKGDAGTGYTIPKT